MMMGNEIVVY
jgi:hypothetical protein